MADYKVDSIAEVKVADDPSSVRVAVVAGAEQVVLTIDWRKASDLIDRMAAVNHEIRHSLSVPDWRAQRIRAGCLLAVLEILELIYTGAADHNQWKPQPLTGSHQRQLVLTVLNSPGRQHKVSPAVALPQ